MKRLAIVATITMILAGAVHGVVYNNIGNVKADAIKAPDTKAVVSTLSDLRTFDRANRVNNVFMAGRTTAGDGGEGVFRWDSSDLSAYVSADPLSGIYVAPQATPTGASGAWVRIRKTEAPFPEWFGAKGDGKYNTSGDGDALSVGSDNSAALSAWISTRKATNNTGGHYGGSLLALPTGVYKTTGSLSINDHYTTIAGEGYGASIIHALASGGNTDTPVLKFKKQETADAWDSLLTGGGLKDMMLKTDNSAIRNVGLLLDYVEYMSFSHLYLEGFGESGLRGGFWESNFDDLKFLIVGINQTADGDGNPITGVIDTDSQTTNPYRNASNNTLFTKTTFSSCIGTLIKLTAYANASPNIHFDGVYAETSNVDHGTVENLPMIFLFRATNAALNNGFITVNSTGVARDATIVKIKDAGVNGSMSISNFVMSMNLSSYQTRVTRRLRSFMNIGGTNSRVNMSNVTIEDASDSVGYGLGSAPPFFEGNGNVIFNNLTLHVRDTSIGGTRRATNVFARTLNATGNMLWKPYDANGANSGAQKSYFFRNGLVTLVSNEAPTTVDTWQAGDRVEYTTAVSVGQTGLVCTQAGTSGTLTGVTGSIDLGSNQLTVNSADGLLVGDWVTIAGCDGYNRIAAILGNVVTLEGNEDATVVGADVSFLPPVWVSSTQVLLSPGSVPFAGSDGKLSQNNDHLFWDSTLRRLGVGTPSPGSPLHVSVNGSSDPIATFAGTNLTDSVSAKVSHPTSALTLAIAGNSGAFMPTSSQHDGIIFSQATHNLIFGTGSTESFRVNTDGNFGTLKKIGIGTNTPDVPLDVLVDGTTDPIAKLAGTNAADSLVFYLTHPGASLAFALAGNSGAFMPTSAQHDGMIYAQSGHNLLLGVGGTEYLRVNSTGATVTGSISASSGGSANHVICWKPDGKTLGYCSVVVAADGTCGTCN